MENVEVRFCRECGAPFEPRNPAKVFCSRQCKGRRNQRDYREANREKVRKYAREYARAYREANPEKRREQARAYREANREKVREYARAYREANREKRREQERAYRAKKKIEARAGSAQEPREIEPPPRRGFLFLLTAKDSESL